MSYPVKTIAPYLPKFYIKLVFVMVKLYAQKLATEANIGGTNFSLGVLL